MEIRSGKFVVACGILLFGLSGWGCAPKLLPLTPAGPGDPASAGFARAESPVLGFSARQGELEHCSPDWDKLLIPLEVRIENRTEGRISIQPEDFILQDESGRQYQAVDARELSALEPRGEGGRSAFFTFGLAYGYEGGREALGAGFPLGYNTISRSDRCPAEIFLKALSTQPIEPRAFAQGMVFFRGGLKKAHEFSLKFHKNLPPAEPVNLELRFRSK
jgi:hypothetical protein